MGEYTEAQLIKIIEEKVEKTFSCEFGDDLYQVILHALRDVGALKVKYIA